MPPNYIQIMDVTPYKKTRQICKAQVTQWSESSPAANTILLQWDFWEIQISKGKGNLVTNRSSFFSELSPICQNSFQNRGRKSGHSTLIIYPFCIQKEWQLCISYWISFSGFRTAFDLSASALYRELIYNQYNLHVIFWDTCFPGDHSPKHDIHFFPGHRILSVATLKHMF